MPEDVGFVCGRRTFEEIGENEGGMGGKGRVEGRGREGWREGQEEHFWLGKQRDGFGGECCMGEGN